MHGFKHAIVRPPAENFAAGLTSVDLGTPDVSVARHQHQSYCAALEECGLSLITLAPDQRYPDSTFVEDTAVLTPERAIITRPGAASRLGEIDEILDALRRFYPLVDFINEPGTVDGGDICEAGKHFFIGISQRTNEPGANQLANILTELGFTSTLIDIRAISNILHLKSGLAYLSDNRLVVIETLAEHPEFSGYERLVVNHGAEYVANCVQVNDRILVAAGFEGFTEQLESLDYQTITLEMSEFQKMDGGLSCLSLRF